MKAVACLMLLFLVGFVSTQYAFKPGNRYVYQARGRLMSGISDINTQYAGLEVTYRISVQVLSPTTIVLKPENFKAVELNSELNGGWRDGELQNETPVEIKPKLLEYLESPIELSMRNGIVNSIKVEQHLPTWAVNIKKSQASHFVLDTTGSQVILSGNLNRKINSVRPEDQNTDSGFFYEVMENTVLGECKTYYTVSQQGPFQPPYPIQPEAQPGQESSQEHSNEENERRSNSRESSEENTVDGKNLAEGYDTKYYYAPNIEKYDETSAYNYYKPAAYQQYSYYRQYAQTPDSESAEDSQETRQGEVPWPKTFDSFCGPQDQVYEVIKTVNFTACKVKPTITYSTFNGMHDRSGENTIGTAFDRFVISRYLACGKDRRQYTILNIKQEEQVNFGLRLNQKTFAGTIQNFTLISITKAQIPIKVQKPKVIHDLSYTFDPQEQRLQKSGKVDHGFEDERNDNDSSEETMTNQTPRRDQSDEDDSSSMNEDSIETTEHYYTNKAIKRRPRAVMSSDSASSEESEETKKNDEFWAKYDTAAEAKAELPKPSLKYAPNNPYLASPLRTSGMKKRIQDLMKEIQEDILTDKESIAKAETMSKISTVAKILRYLNYVDVEELYHQIASKIQTEADQTNRNVYLDAMCIAGTNPNINFLVDLIKKKDLAGEQAAQIISTFPMYLRTPTEQIIRVIFELMDSSSVEDSTSVKTAAILAFSNILYQSCVNTEIKNSRYPVQLYGEFCDEKLVKRAYTPWFIKNLKKHMESKEQEDKHWVTTYLVALGNIGVEDVIPVVQQILDDKVEPYIKVQAVFALKHLLVSRSALNIPVTEIRAVDRSTIDLLTDDLIEKKVLPILMSVQNDKSEHPEVRMAAISLLIYNTNSDLTVWQQLAYNTWSPASQEVHAFTYSTLKHLAQLQPPLSPIHQKMCLKAKAVLSLCKPFNAGYAKSQNYYNSQWLDHVQTGFLQHFEFFGSKDSIIPNYMYYRNNIQYGNGALDSNPIEFDMQGQTIQRLASFIVTQFVEKTSVSEPHHQLNTIHNVLSISQREQDEKPEASIRIKLRQEMERLWSINEESIQQLITQAKDEFLPKLLNGWPINYQKTMHLMENSFEFPSAMGIPIHFYFRMPLHVSLRGQVKVVMENGVKDVQVQAELHPVYGWKTHTKIALKVPYTGKAYQAGVQRHVVVDAPFRASIRKAPRGQIVVAITPALLTPGTPAGEIDLVSFHQKPYTAIISDECWPAVHIEGGKMEIIHAVEEPYKNTQVLEKVRESLGLHLELEEETEYHDQNETPNGWIKFFKRYHTPGCWFNTEWLGPVNVRYAERKLTLDVSKSETKTLGIAIGYNKHRNLTHWDLWESKSSQSSEESASSESKRESSSQEETSDERRQQPTRGQRRRAEASSSEKEAWETGSVVAVAVIGKSAPIKFVEENRGQIQKILSKDYPSTVQYLFQGSKSTGRFYFRATSGDSANKAAELLPKTHSSLEAIREMVADAQNQKSQLMYCAEFEGEYDAPKHANRHELIVLRKRLLAEDLVVKVKGELQFGQTCDRMPHKIKIQGKLERGQKMTEWAKEKSPEAKKCEEDEKREFTVSPVCMEVSEQQAAALNKADLKIKFSQNLPVQLINRTDDVEDFFKAMFYNYLSSDNFHVGAGQGQIHVDARMTPNKEFIDVVITKPNSRISFRSMETNGLVKAVLPLTATRALPNNFFDRVLRADAQTSCVLEGNHVSTFDNVTYRFNPNVATDCYHLLAKDCSGREPVAVLAKDVTARKMEIILLLGGQTKIELNQPSQQKAGLYGTGKVEVEVNEQKVETLPRIIVAKDTTEEIARIEELQDGGVQVIAKQFQVATNGKYVYIQARNSLRNRTCGLCGDFDGEKIGEFRGPKDCALSSGSLLVASYSFQSLDTNEKAVCKVNRNAKAQLQHEQQLCFRNTAYQPNQPKMYSSYYLSSSVGVDNQCVKKFEPAIRQAVYDSVNAALKPFEWITQQRERMCHNLADKVILRLKEILREVRDVKGLVEKIQEVVCEEAKKLQIHSLAVEGICKGSKGLQYLAYRVALNPIAEETKCFTPFKLNYNPIEAIEQVKYALSDESEHDDSALPYIPAHKLPMTCEAKLEETLSISISKYAYYLLLVDFHLTETERLRITGEVARAVRQAVRKTVGATNNVNIQEELVKEIVKMVDEVFPVGPLQRWMNTFMKKFVRIVLVKLCKVDKCCFAGPNQQQAAPYYYQQE